MTMLFVLLGKPEPLKHNLSGLWPNEYLKKIDLFTNSMMSIFIYSLLVDITPIIRKPGSR